MVLDFFLIQKWNWLLSSTVVKQWFIVWHIVFFFRVKDEIKMLH